MRRDLLVQFALPVEPLGDRLDHEVAFGELREIGAVVARIDGEGTVARAERRGLLPGKARDRLRHEAVGITLLARKVEKQDRNVRVDEMRGDLRAHHAGAKHGNLADDQWRR